MMFMHGAGWALLVTVIYQMTTNCQGHRLLTVTKPETSILQSNYRHECQDVCSVDPPDGKHMKKFL